MPPSGILPSFMTIPCAKLRPGGSTKAFFPSACGLFEGERDGASPAAEA